MIALVTGAGGFIGNALCRSLSADGTEVRALLRNDRPGPWARAFCIDLAERRPPEEVMTGVDCVYHLAAYTHAVDERDDEDEKYRRVNVDGTRRMLEVAGAAGVRRFVFVSSVKAMGEGAEEPLDESNEPAPTTAYGQTKLEAERLVTDGGYIDHSAVLRLVPVYGPGAKGNIPRMIEAVARGRFPSVPDAGNRRSLIHVDDVVAAMRILAANADASGGVFIATDGQRYSLRALYEMMCEALGKRPGRQLPRGLFSLFALGGDLLGFVLRKRAPYDTIADRKLFGSAVYNHDALTRLGYRPHHTLVEALPAMIEAMGLPGKQRDV